MPFVVDDDEDRGFAPTRAAVSTTMAAEPNE